MTCLEKKIICRLLWNIFFPIFVSGQFKLVAKCKECCARKVQRHRAGRSRLIAEGDFLFGVCSLASFSIALLSLKCMATKFVARGKGGREVIRSALLLVFYHRFSCRMGLRRGGERKVCDKRGGRMDKLIHNASIDD